jgi:hypothetical protein
MLSYCLFGAAVLCSALKYVLCDRSLVLSKRLLQNLSLITISAVYLTLPMSFAFIAFVVLISIKKPPDNLKKDSGFFTRIKWKCAGSGFLFGLCLVFTVTENRLTSTQPTKQLYAANPLIMGFNGNYKKLLNLFYSLKFP